MSDNFNLLGTIKSIQKHIYKFCCILLPGVLFCEQLATSRCIKQASRFRLKSTMDNM